MTPETVTLREPYRHLDITELLRAKPSALLDVAPEAEQALEQIGIHSLFDLGSSWLFGNARAVAALSQPGSPQARIGIIASDLLDGAASVPSVDDASKLGIEHLQGLSADHAQSLKDALGIETIDDLAFWPPQATARVLMATAAGQEAGSAEPGAELRPRFGDYPTERVYYDTLVMLDSDSELAAPHDLSTDGPVPVTPAVNSPGFARPAVGARLTLAQSWYAQGVTLGHLLHCLALAPGEATRVAVIDWTRRTSAFSAESIDQTERLDDSATHSRSLSEVQDAVAREAQQGFSEASSSTSSTSSSEQMSMGTGLLTSLFASGDASIVLNQATTSSDAQSRSWSAGERDVSASITQRVQDRTEQHASSTRNRRASAIREVSQSEHENVSTRVVANYNHMHALTVQYFEVVQVYRTDIEVHRIDRVIFVPLELLDFNQDDVIERFRAPLLRNALTRRAFDLLVEPSATVTVTPSATTLAGATSPGVVPYAVSRQPVPTMAMRARMKAETESGDQPTDEPGDDTSPKQEGPVAVGKVFVWDDHAILRASRILGVPVVRPGSDDLHIPADVELRAISFTGLSIDRIRLSRSGSSVELDAPAGSWVGLPERTVLADLSAIAVSKASSGPVNGTMTLECALRGVPMTLPGIPLTLGQGTDFQAAVSLTSDTQARLEELRRHLMDNRLHYSQAAYRSLDAAAITTILAPFRYNGVPLVDQVDPAPVTVAANFLVVRAPADEGNEQALTEWGKVLAGRGVRLGPGESRLVSLPTGGVFAEAVLGRSNSAEPLDITRFWNWQDSPIPIQPPEIAPVSTGTRATGEDLTPGQLGAPVLNISNPTALPDPSGLAAILNAVASGNMFRDMSGLGGTQGIVSAGIEGTLKAATDAGQIGSANMRTEAQKAVAMGQIAADLVKTMMGVPGGGSSSQGISGEGARINQGRDMDQRGNRSLTPEGRPVGSGQGGAPSPGGTPPKTTVSAAATNGNRSFEDAAFESSLPSGESDAARHLVDTLAESVASSADSDRSFIVESPSLTPDARAFRPATKDKSGKVTLSVRVPNMPESGSLRWSVPPPKGGEFGRMTLSDDAGGTASVHFGGDVQILALDPGVTAIDVEVRDSHDLLVESQKYPISVPQFITIDEAAAEFDGVLTGLTLADAKDAIVRTAKDVVDTLLAKENVRTIWRVGPFHEVVPAHIPPASVTAVTIHGEPPAATPRLFGQTSPPAGPQIFNETIDVFPGAFDNPPPAGPPRPGEVDTETQAIGVELASMASAGFNDPDLKNFAVTAYGRLIGENMAHEIVHAILGAGHTPLPALDLHSDGASRTFRQRTGLEDTTHTGPLTPSNFVDHGVAAIVGLNAANQANIDRSFPVPPTFT